MLMATFCGNCAKSTVYNQVQYLPVHLPYVQASKCASIVCGLLFWLGVEADFCAGAGVVGVVLVLVVLGGVEAVGAVGRGRRPGVGIGVGVACGNGGIGIGMLGMPDMQDDMPGMPGVMGVEDIGRGGGGMGIGGMGGIIGGIDEPITGANGLAEKMNETAGADK